MVILALRLLCEVLQNLSSTFFFSRYLGMLSLKESVEIPDNYFGIVTLILFLILNFVTYT